MSEEEYRMSNIRGGTVEGRNYGPFARTSDEK